MSLKNSDYKALVVTAYDHLLNYFDWNPEQGYMTTTSHKHAAIVVISRIRLEKLKTLWQ